MQILKTSIFWTFLFFSLQAKRSSMLIIQPKLDSMSIIPAMLDVSLDQLELNALFKFLGSAYKDEGAEWHNNFIEMLAPSSITSLEKTQDELLELYYGMSAGNPSRKVIPQTIAKRYRNLKKTLFKAWVGALLLKEDELTQRELDSIKEELNLFASRLKAKLYSVVGKDKALRDFIKSKISENRIQLWNDFNRLITFLLEIRAAGGLYNFLHWSVDSLIKAPPSFLMDSPNLIHAFVKRWTALLTVLLNHTSINDQINLDLLPRVEELYRSVAEGAVKQSDPSNPASILDSTLLEIFNEWSVKINDVQLIFQFNRIYFESKLRKYDESEDNLAINEDIYEGPILIYDSLISLRPSLKSGMERDLLLINQVVYSSALELATFKKGADFKRNAIAVFRKYASGQFDFELEVLRRLNSIMVFMWNHKVDDPFIGFVNEAIVKFISNMLAEKTVFELHETFRHFLYFINKRLARFHDIKAKLHQKKICQTVVDFFYLRLLVIRMNSKFDSDDLYTQPGNELYSMTDVMFTENSEYIESHPAYEISLSLLAHPFEQVNLVATPDGIAAKLPGGKKNEDDGLYGIVIPIGDFPEFVDEKATTDFIKHFVFTQQSNEY